MWMTRPVVTLYAAELGAGPMEVGMLTSIYAFLPLLLAVHAGKFVDRAGNRLPVLIGMSCFVLGMAAPYLFSSLWSLYFSQVIAGISHIIMNVALQNALGQATTRENRDHYFGIFSMVVALTGFLGPIIGGYISEHLSYAAVFLISGVLCFGPIVASPFLPAGKSVQALKEQAGEDSAGAAPSRERTSFVSLLKLPQLRAALFSSGLVLYSRDIFVAYFPLYGQNIGLSDSTIGWIIAIQGLAMMPVRLYMAHLAKWMGRHRLLIASIVLAGVSFLLVPVFDQVYVLMILSALMGFGLGCGQPLSMVTIFNVSPQHRTGEVLGLRLATNRLFQLIAPLFFGLVGKWIGLVSVFYVSGSFLIGGSYFARSKQEKPDAGEEGS